MGIEHDNALNGMYVLDTPGIEFVYYSFLRNFVENELTSWWLEYIWWRNS